MKKLIILTLLCLSTPFVFAQSSKEKESKRINDLFLNAIDRSQFRDTNMVYLFSVKVEAIKDKTGKYQINSIQASDSSAYKVYKNFDFVKRINYALFTRNQAKVNFVFPVAIFLFYPGKPKTDLVSMDEISKKLNAYWFINEHSNLVDENIYFPVLNLTTTTVIDR